MKTALVEIEKCDPDQCELGVCAARKACPVKAVVQFDRGDSPQVDSSLCRGCGKCLLQCPTRAIILS